MNFAQKMSCMLPLLHGYVHNKPVKMLLNIQIGGKKFLFARRSRAKGKGKFYECSSWEGHYGGRLVRHGSY